MAQKSPVFSPHGHYPLVWSCRTNMCLPLSRSCDCQRNFLKWCQNTRVCNEYTVSTAHYRFKKRHLSLFDVTLLKSQQVIPYSQITTYSICRHRKFYTLLSFLVSLYTDASIISTDCWTSIFPRGPQRVVVMAVPEKHARLFFMLYLTLETGRKKTFFLSNISLSLASHLSNCFYSNLQDLL